MSIWWYILLSFILFSIGVIGVLIRRNAIIIFMSIEIMLNAVNLAFVAFSRHFGNLNGQIMVFFIMAVAAAEAAIGLSILVQIYRDKETLDVDEINVLKG